MGKIYTVTEINKYIKGALDKDSELNNVQISGEVSNFKRQQPSGHCYFSLKDRGGVLKCVMFRYKAMSLKFEPQNGETVIAIGHISVYEAGGSYQLYVDTLMPKGQGDLMLEYECLKQKLLQEGLFDSSVKPEVPDHPRAVGIITSPTGAAVRDIITVSRRRSPGIKLYLFPVKVQGAGSSEEIAKAVHFFNVTGLVDVLIVGRGGGSIEDLWAFNEELTTRAVAASRIPVISAVGHETDTTLCDYAASKRAATPSQAAEMAVQDVSGYEQKVARLKRSLELQWQNKLTQLQYRLDRAVNSRMLLNPQNLYADQEECLQRLLKSRMLREPGNLYKEQEERLQRVMTSKVLREPQSLFTDKEQRLDMALQKVNQLFETQVQDSDHRFALAIAKLEGLNPLSALSRGYSVSKVKNKVLTSIEQLACGEEIVTSLADGNVYSIVQKVVKK